MYIIFQARLKAEQPVFAVVSAVWERLTILLLYFCLTGRHFASFAGFFSSLTLSTLQGVKRSREKRHVKRSNRKNGRRRRRASNRRAPRHCFDSVGASDFSNDSTRITPATDTRYSCKNWHYKRRAFWSYPCSMTANIQVVPAEALCMLIEHDPGVAQCSFWNHSTLAQSAVLLSYKYSSLLQFSFRNMRHVLLHCTSLATCSSCSSKPAPSL